MQRGFPFCASLARTLIAANAIEGELETALDARGHQRFHARQIFRWIYKRGVTDIDAMTDLSRDLRATLANEFSLGTPALATRGFQEADAHVRATQPDVVICDLVVNNEERGWEIIEMLTLDPKTTGIPLIVCSAAVKSPTIRTTT